MKRIVIPSVILASAYDAFASQPTNDLRGQGCNIACKELSFLLPDRVSLENSSIYDLGNSNYWSRRQADQRPACRISPKSAVDVSVTITKLRTNHCQFAVRSGGHASFQGASNIGESGVTIDLHNLDEIVVSEDRKQVSVGGGVLWSTLYKNLDAQNLSVVGGRSGDIGVGGLTLGGGISFFSGQYGWACDNVINYQIVLADGSVQNANQEEHPDLYFALRGGGNNFGIVTRFDLGSFEQGKMWGGQSVYTEDKGAELYKALYTFNTKHQQDPRAAVIVATAYVPATNAYLYTTSLEYSEPTADAAILQDFTSIPSLQSTTRVTNLTDLVLELGAAQPPGLRESFWTFTVHNDVQIMSDVEKSFKSHMSAVQDASGIFSALVFQPLSTAMSSHFTSRGGNAIGITCKTGPLILINISITWERVTDDERILKSAADFVDESIALAKKRNLAHDFIYQNYAAEKQDVFHGYGAANLARLRCIQKTYDPTGVFTRLQPGYFKLH